MKMCEKGSNRLSLWPTVSAYFLPVGSKLVIPTPEIRVILLALMKDVLKLNPLPLITESMGYRFTIEFPHPLQSGRSINACE